MSRASMQLPRRVRAFRRRAGVVRRAAGLLLLGLLPATARAASIEAVLTTGHRIAFRAIRLDPPTLTDERSGFALRLDLVQEIIFNPGPLPPLSGTALPAPPPGAAAALCTLFAADGTPHQGRLASIGDGQILLEPAEGAPLTFRFEEVRRIRFPDPRPWSRAGELAELDDPELARAFPQLVELAAGGEPRGPVVVSRSRLLLLQAEGLTMDRHRTIELFGAPPEEGAIRAIDVPPGAQLRIHHATAVDAEGRLYHYLDGNLRQEPITGGGERFQLLPPHPAGPHILSLDVAINYVTPRPGTIEHTFNTQLAGSQLLEAELAPGTALDWATTPGAPIASDLTDRRRPKWYCRVAPGSPAAAAPSSAAIRLTPKTAPAGTAQP